MPELTPELLNTTTWKIPNPLAIVGSHHNQEFNGMTASWISQFSMDPVMARQKICFKETGDLKV